MAETDVSMVLLLAVGFLKSHPFLTYCEMLTSTLPVVLLALKSIYLESIQQCGSTVFHLQKRGTAISTFCK